MCSSFDTTCQVSSYSLQQRSQIMGDALSCSPERCCGTKVSKSMTREIKYVALKNGQVDIYSSDEETESFDDEYDSERDPLADDYSDAESNGSFPSSDDS